MDQVAAKKQLQELIKNEELKNRNCVDCSNPNPQWASLSHAVFLCLQCAGIHRGFGVHISFVRSVSMDTWQEDQLRRMKLGGNEPFRTFMRNYTPAEQGGYREGMDAYEKYHCWAASQYREKLSADLDGKPWSPSPPLASFSPPGGLGSPERPSSAQGLRKSRASARNAAGSTLRRETGSPASLSSLPPTPNSSNSPSLTQKTANESYFASLGSVNASRRDDLPPAQGGRYQGFGNTPSPPASSQHPSFGLSSAAAPSLSDFQENPTAALTKGWSLFSAAVAGASRVVAENVIQPGLEKVRDPTLQAQIKGYVSEASRKVGEIGQNANQWSKTALGVDVAGHVGDAYDNVRDRVGGGRHEGYGALASYHDDESSALYHDGEDDFFESSVNSANHSDKGYMQQTGTTSTGDKHNDSNSWDNWTDF